MSGRGKGNKGLGVYRQKIELGETLPIFLTILPQKYHKVFIEGNVPKSVIEHWLSKVFDGEKWEISDVKEEIQTILDIKTSIRFVKVNDTRKIYNELKKIHETKEVTKRRKKNVLKDFMELDFVKYNIGAPAYIQRLQSFETYKKLM
jgi:hypothetical protein